jgi:hypothetical protein
MSLFSGDEEDPDRRAAHSAMENLSYHAQGLLCGATEGVLNLPPAELAELTKFLRAADRGVRRWRRRLRNAGVVPPGDRPAST